MVRIISDFVQPFRTAVAAQFDAQPFQAGPLLRATDLDGLPDPVRRYIEAWSSTGTG